MRSFFWKIFLSFWATMALIVVGAVVASAVTIGHRLEALQDSRPAQLAVGAGTALGQGGRAELTRWLAQETDSIDNLRIFIVDEHQQELLDRWVPRRPLRRLRELERLQQGLADNYRPARFAPQLTGPEGETYTVLLLQRRSGPFGLIGVPGVPGTTLLLALVVSGLVSLLLARYFARPVVRLQAATRALATGRLDARVGAELRGRKDELATLATDFDDMAERLQQLLDGQRRLLRDVSHELRSPLTRLKVALGLARRGDGVSAQLDRIDVEADRLEALIARILQLARLSAEDSAPAMAALDLVELVDAVVEDARYEGEPRGVEIAWRHLDSATARGDAELLASAVENVLRNALRYAPADSRVDITLDREGNELRLAVRDRGPGVPEPELARLFEPFYRVAEARDRGSGGDGLGLAITARVAALHGGRVAAVNAEGGGLGVTIILPAAPD